MSSDMLTYDDVCTVALALSPAERLNLMILLSESLRKPLDAPKKPRKPRAAKEAKEGEEKKAPNAWQAGLVVVRAYLKTHELKGSLAMKLGAELKKLGSWPNPTEAEIATAMAAVPEEDRVSKASKPTKASGGSKASGSKRSKSSKLELPEGLTITTKKLTAAQKELYDALSEEDREKYDAEVEKRRARAEKAKATRAAKKTAKEAPKEEDSESEDEFEEAAAAGGGGGAASATLALEAESEDESEEEGAEIKKWVGDLGKGEREYERLDYEGVSYLWETTKKGERKYLGALKTKKDGSYTVDKKVAEPELE